MAECELCTGTNEVKLDAKTYGSRIVPCPKCVHRILVGKLVEAGRANAKLQEELLRLQGRVGKSDEEIIRKLLSETETNRG